MRYQFAISVGPSELHSRQHQVAPMAEDRPNFLRYRPEELVALRHDSDWRFESAEILDEGGLRRFADVYQQAMASVSVGPDGWDSASRLFESLIAEAPVFAEGYFQLARIYLLQGQNVAALSLARYATALSPDNDAYEILLIAALFVNGCESEATACVEAFAKRKDGAGEQIDDGAAARRVFSRSLSLALPGRVLRGNRLLQLEEACADVLRALDPGDPPAVDCAIQELMEFLEANPRHGEIRFWLAELLRRRGKTDRASELCGAATGFGRGDWPIEVEAGVLLWEMGDKDGALARFEDAALLNDNLPLFSAERISSESAEALNDWYRNVLDELAAVPGAYSGIWPFGPAPSLRGRPLQSAVPWPEILISGLADIRSGTKLAPAWWLLARNDVLARYRRTTLGPWWVVLGTGIALVGMAAVWSLIFSVKMEDFFPYLSSGYVTWLLLSSLVVEGCSVFTDGQAAAIQRNLDLPRFLHVYRLVTRNFIFFFHALVIFVLGAIYYGVQIGPQSLLAVPGLILLYLNGLWIAALFGIVGARFRDFAPAISAIMTVMFFVTPVMWKPDMLGDRGHIATMNPFTHLIAIVRDPLLGMPVAALSWIVAGGICVCGWIAIVLVYSRFRKQIIFWI